MSEKVEFQPNVPTPVVLAYDSPLNAPSKRGGPMQYAYSLEGDRIMYLDEDPHNQIQSSGAKRGDQLEITKKVVRHAGKNIINWEVIHVDTDYQPGDPEGYPDTVDDDDRDDDEPTPAPPPRRTPPPPPPPAAAKSTKSNAVPPARATRPNGNAATPPPIRKTEAAMEMCAALCAAIDAAAEAESYARKKSLTVEFGAEDIRAIAATLFIQHNKGGAK